jgi:hypothetical protein
VVLDYIRRSEWEFNALMPTQPYLPSVVIRTFLRKENESIPTIATELLKKKKVHLVQRIAKPSIVYVE